jgi:hypothetical protein
MPWPLWRRFCADLPRRFDETHWFTQIADLFQTSVPNINIHFKAIYDEGELSEAATIKSYSIVRTEGTAKSPATPNDLTTLSTSQYHHHQSPPVPR